MSQITSRNDTLHAWRAHEPEQEYLAFLFSSGHTGYSGGRSLLAYGLQHEQMALPALNAARWYGYAGYGMRHQYEQLHTSAPSIIHLPDSYWMQLEHEHVFTHDMTDTLALEPTEKYVVESLHSNMSKAEYLAHVAATLQEIKQGSFYQANITRKFYGTLAEGTSPAAIFQQLCAISPAPYAAYLKCGDVYILSSSPELFLRLQKHQLISRPIKGSMGHEQHGLAQSYKDRAENLMIVDLMRNDFSRICTAGSVKVPALYDVDRFSTIQHLSSQIHGEVADTITSDALLHATFPPGSMTGAPKIAAMQWCAAREPQERGVYSGALGWIGGEDTPALELSVVIRTLIIRGNQFEFQVGGGIVADSDPETEWQETMVKARGIAGALGLPLSALEAL